MSKEDVVNYVMNSPYNSNEAVLRGLLEDVDEGGSSENANWNENDPDSKAYILNRPFYESLEEAVLFEQDVNFSNDAGSNYYVSLDSSFNSSISVDTVITLTVDDIAFTGVPQLSNAVYYIGSENPGDTEGITTNKVGCMFSKVSEDTLSGVSMLMVSSADFAKGTHHVQIKGADVLIVHKLSMQYVDLNLRNGEGENSIVQLNCTATGKDSFASGHITAASGEFSHAEGVNTTASADSSHAEGTHTTSSGGAGSHAEGTHTTASGGAGSHAEGSNTTARGNASHAEGVGTIASGIAQHVFGRLNVAENVSATETPQYVEIVGNGTNSQRSNARTLDWFGNESLQGSLTLGTGTADATTITAAQLKALIALLNA